MRSLLDVNALIAILDARHPFHQIMTDWWDQEKTQGWASCPITENGVVRIMSGAKYRAVDPLSPNDVIKALEAFVGSTDHKFWPDDLSLRDSLEFDRDAVTSSYQITDSYLLALAAKHGGRLVTLDGRIKLASARRASNKHLVIIR